MVIIPSQMNLSQEAQMKTNLMTSLNKTKIKKRRKPNKIRKW